MLCTCISAWAKKSRRKQYNYSKGGLTMTLLDFIIPIAVAISFFVSYYFGMRYKTKQFCERWGYDFRKMWPDVWNSRIDYSMPCWEYKYLLPGLRKWYVEQLKRELRYINRELTEIADKMDGHINAMNELTDAIGKAIKKEK